LVASQAAADLSLSYEAWDAPDAPAHVDADEAAPEAAPDHAHGTSYAQRTEALARLEALSVRAVTSVLRRLGGGTAGIDYARSTKRELVAYALSTYDNAAVLSAVDAEAAGEAVPKGVPAPKALPVPAGAGTIPGGSTQQATPGIPGAGSNGTVPGEALEALAEALGRVVALGGHQAAAPVDADAVRAIAQDVVLGATPSFLEAARAAAEAVLAGQAPRVVEVRQHDREPARVEGAHPLCEKVLRLSTAGVNVLLVGPAGCGKTHLAEQVAKALGRPFGALSLTAGITESALTGRLLPTGDGGRFEYVESPFVRLYGGGGVFLFDELDAADPNMLLVVNSALANGHMEVEQRAASDLPTRVDRHADTIMLGAANTYGTGADAKYVGRGVLDAASLDRWYIVEMDYDRAYEARLFGGQAPEAKPWQAADPATCDQDVLALGKWVQALRDKAERAKVTRIVSYRMVQKAVAARRAGVPSAEIQRDLLAGWSADELRQVGEAR
jgi:MoxR-like ATPase